MQNQGAGLLQPLVSAFRNADLGISRYDGFPFVQDETAKSHLLRIMDFWNTKMWDDTSTNAICKEVILTLLQCAARLYEDKVHTKEAVDLIKSDYTRAILSLSFQDILCQVIHQRCEESIRSDRLEEINAKNYLRRVDLFSAIRKNKARQLNYQAIIFENISSLCRFYGATLQNSFDSPRIDEQFMFHNYVILSKVFNRDEKSWLVTLLPNTFQWEGQDSCSSTNGDGLLAANYSATKETNRDSPSNASMAISLPETTATSNVIRGTNQNFKMSSEIPISLELVEHLHWIPPRGLGERSPLITDGGVQLSICQATSNEENERWAPCGELGIGNPASDFESFALTSKDLEFEKVVDPSRKRAMSYPESSIRAVTSALKAPHEFHGQMTSQTEGSRPVGIKIERNNGGDYHKELRDWLLSPLQAVPEDDWNFLGSDDDSEIIFPFSLGSRNNAADRALVSNVPHGADEAHSGGIPSAKDIHLAPSVSAPSLPSRNKHKRRSSQLLGGWMSGHQNKRGLEKIPEEPEGSLEVE